MAWKDVHEHLSLLARKKGAIDAEEATWLLRARRERVHEHLGYASIAEYVGRIFGYGPRLAHEKLRVAEALEELPRMKALLVSAELSWSTLRELTRVAVPETEDVWIEAARGKTVREIERMVSGKKRGDDPNAKPEPKARRSLLRFEVSEDTLAAFRDARDQCLREVGHHLEDDELLRMILERALVAGGRDEGRSPYQVKLTVCSECGRGERAAGGELHPMETSRVEQALCDAQVLGDDPGDPMRASQEVAPKVRRSILRRDGGCIVPGCTNSAFREIHHVVFRAHGGGHDPENLCDLCSAHHAAVHRGAIRIEGSYAEGFRVCHADGRPYGTAPLARAPTWTATTESAPTWAHKDDQSAAAAAARADAVAALRQSGFKAREAREAVAAAAGETLEEILREALVSLGRRSTSGYRASETAFCWPVAGRCPWSPGSVSRRS